MKNELKRVIKLAKIANDSTKHIPKMYGLEKIPRYDLPLTLSEQVITGLPSFNWYEESGLDKVARELNRSLGGESFSARLHLSDIGYLDNNHYKDLVKFSEGIAEVSRTISEISNAVAPKISAAQEFLSGQMAILQSSLQGIENLQNSGSFVNNWMLSVQESIEQSIAIADEEDSEKVRKLISELLTDVSSLLTGLSIDTKEGFNRFVNFIYKVANSRKYIAVKELRDLILMLFTIYTVVVPTVPQNIDNRTEIHNNYEISQGAPVYVVASPKTLRFDRRDTSKVIAVIPVDTEVYIVRKFKVWAWIAYQDADGQSQIGWTRMEGMTEL